MNVEESNEDPVTLMLQKTGCIELHYKVQVLPSKSSDFIQIYKVFIQPFNFNHQLRSA